MIHMMTMDRRTFKRDFMSIILTNGLSFSLLGIFLLYVPLHISNKIRRYYYHLIEEKYFTDWKKHCTLCYILKNQLWTYRYELKEGITVDVAPFLSCIYWDWKLVFPKEQREAHHKEHCAASWKDKWWYNVMVQKLYGEQKLRRLISCKIHWHSWSCHLIFWRGQKWGKILHLNGCEIKVRLRVCSI